MGAGGGTSQTWLPRVQSLALLEPWGPKLGGSEVWLRPSMGHSFNVSICGPSSRGCVTSQLEGEGHSLSIFSISARLLETPLRILNVSLLCCCNLSKNRSWLSAHALPLRVCCAKLLQLRLFATLWTVACQAPLSMGFSRQESWSGLPGPPPGDLPNPGIEPESPVSPALADGFFTASATWEACITPVTRLKLNTTVETIQSNCCFIKRSFKAMNFRRKA